MLRDKKEDFYAFILFLKEKQILAQYKSNLIVYGCAGRLLSSNPSPISLKQFIARTSPINWIFFAFNWVYTEEGGDFWNQIDLEWRKIISLLHTIRNETR